MLELVAAAAISAAGCQAPERVVERAVAVGRAVPAGDTEGDKRSIKYCEYFVPQGADSVRVLYFDGQGKKIAEKQLAKATDSTFESVANDPKPEVIQEDFRSGEVREVTRARDGWLFRYRKDRKGRWQEASVEAQALDVIDAGFDPYVREHWSQLVGGEEIAFEFASPVHKRAVRLRARSVNCKQAEHSRDHLCVEVDLAQPWLRWLAGDIFLVYSSADRRLRYFEGVVNILDANGGSQSLQIEYFHRSETDR